MQVKIQLAGKAGAFAKPSAMLLDASGKVAAQGEKESARSILWNYTLKYVLRISYNDIIFSGLLPLWIYVMLFSTFIIFFCQEKEIPALEL